MKVKQKNIRRKVKRDALRAAMVKETAELKGITPRAVQMALAGDTNNEDAVEIFMTLNEKWDGIMQEMKNWSTIFNPSPKHN